MNEISYVKVRFFLVIALCLTTDLSTVNAGPNADAKILLHLASPSGKSPCENTLPACNQINTNGGLSPQSYYSYVLIADADSVAGVAGVQFGIGYNLVANVGVDIFTWNMCGDQEFPSPEWPDALTGNIVTWSTRTNCQRTTIPGSGVVTAVGYFYCAAYSADVLSIIPRPQDGRAEIAWCSAAPDTGDVISPLNLGTAAFSSGALIKGSNPCGD